MTTDLSTAHTEHEEKTSFEGDMARRLLLVDDDNIFRKRWIAVGQRHGVSTEDGRPADALIDELIAQTPKVGATVRAQLAPDFPIPVADSILEGLQGAADGLRG